MREREGERREGREGERGKGGRNEGRTNSSGNLHVHVPCEVQHYTVICNCATRCTIIMAL